MNNKYGNSAHCCTVSLARSRPDAFDSLYAHGHLDVSTEGKFWLAANMVLGSRWLMTNPCSKPSPGKGPRKVAFHYGDATVAANRSGIFLSKKRLWKKGVCSGNCQPLIDVTRKVIRQHHTNITIGLPGLPLETNQQENYLQSAQVLLEILRFLWAVDSEIILYVFPTKARKNPTARAVRPGSWTNSIPDQAIFEIYPHQVWIRGGLRPFLRFYVGHNVDQDTLFSPAVHEQTIASRECQLRVDVIQAAKVVACGFLVGSYMKTINLDNNNNNK